MCDRGIMLLVMGLKDVVGCHSDIDRTKNHCRLCIRDTLSPLSNICPTRYHPGLATNVGLGIMSP